MSNPTIIETISSEDTKSVVKLQKKSAREDTLLDSALALIQDDLLSVTERLNEQLSDPVARNVVYLITAGGKRLRPALVLLAGSLGQSPNKQALIDAATAVELVHTATLIHDDIIDESRMRRKQPTFHVKWGTERAVLMGDYLYAMAFRLLSGVESHKVIQVMSDACQRLSRGELREVECRYRLDLKEEDYFNIIEDKTASLIGACCSIGALLGGAEERVVNNLATFGDSFGMAFQIIDDCLDLSGDPQKLGKSIHTDLDKGALSLPIIYLIQELSSTERDKLFAPLRRQATNPAFLARIAKAAKAVGAIEKARECARGYVNKAQQVIKSVPVDGLAEACKQLAEYAMVRKR